MKSLLLTLAAASLLIGQEAPAPPPPKAKVGSARPAAAKPTDSKPAATKAAAPVTVASYKSLKFPALRQVKIPEVTQFTLANGMRVYLMENHELPLVNGFVLVRTGNLFDPADKVGLAGITGSVMRSGGTKSKTGDQLDEQLENIAASVEAGIGETSGTVSFRSLKENTDDVLAIFKDVLLNPEFRQDKIDLAKTQTRGGIARRNDEASDIASRELTNTIYGKDNPYGWDIEYRHVDNINREDLVNFYRRYFFPANMMLAVQGDFNSAEMRGKLEKLFADWNYKQPAVPPFPEVRRNAPSGTFFAEKDDVTQSFVEMGHFGGILKDNDFPALSVMSDILGGGFSSRLFRNVRTIKGLAYGINGGWGANYNHPGLFRVSGSTKSQSTVDMIQAAKAEIDKIRTAEVTDQELETAKQSVLNSFVFNFDSPAKILNRMVTYDYHGYPRDFIFQYQKSVEAVTKADVLRVARENLKPEAMTIVAVGNSKEFGKPLTALAGEVKTIDLTIPEAKPAAAPAKSDASSIEKGRKLLQRAQEAAGGADRLAGIKDARSVSEAEIHTPQGTLQSKMTMSYIAPSQFRQQQELPFGTIAVYYDGKGGWVSSPQGTGDMPPPIVRQMQEETFRIIPTLLLSDRNPDRTVNATGDNSVQITDKAGNSVHMEFDPSSGQVLRTRYRMQTMTGEAGEAVATYSDFREVGGFRQPYLVSISLNGQKFVEAKVLEMSFNIGLKAEEISKRP